MAAAQTPPLSGQERRRPQLEAISREARPKSSQLAPAEEVAPKRAPGGHAGAMEAGPG